MQEILFRGKRVDDDEWVFGSFVMDGTEFERRISGKDGYTPWGFIRCYDSDSGKVRMYEVDRTTVGQFVGITDKNGVKIFEGDRINLYTENGFENRVVKWNRLFSAWHAISDGQMERSLFCGFGFEYEVIGNIFDDCERIGGGEQ